MTKFEFASEDVEKLFDEVRDKTNIPQWVVFKVLCNNKLKKIPVKLMKSNEVTEILSEGVNFAVAVNEKIFNGLPIDMQMLAIEQCLDDVAISDTDALSIKPRDFCANKGMLRKHGYEKLIALDESFKSLYDKAKEDEDQAKALTKGKRGRKRKV
jgi:hypothetical protein